MKRLLKQALFYVTAAALSAGAAQAATQCADTINVNSPLQANGFGGNPYNTRNNPSDITAANVGTLTRAMSFAADGQVEKRGAPAVTEQALFFSEGPFVVAANRATGCEYWRFRVKPLWWLVAQHNVVRSSSILFVNEGGGKPALVVVGDAFGYVYAINAATGVEVWNRSVGSDIHHMITGGLQAFQGKLLVPVATKEVISAALEIYEPCCNSHGLLRLLDLYSGKIVWTYNTTSDAKLNLLTLRLGPSGVSIWGTPTVDLARGLIYVPTAQNLSKPTTNNSDSIVALYASSGKPKWIFQATSGDAWNAACQAPSGLDFPCDRPEGHDFDFGAPPILAKLPNGQQALIAGAKNGVVYSLNPMTGKLNWQRRIGQGGSLGGIHWGMAVDTNKVYAAVTDIYVNKLSGLDLLNFSDFTAGVAKNMEPVAGATPGIYALNLLDGTVAWEVHPTREYNGATVAVLHSSALTVTNDVLFSGALTGEIVAYRTSDGARLWSDDTTGAFVDVRGLEGLGGTIDNAGQVVAGRDLLVNSGYSTFGRINAYQAGPGNGLLIYRLPE